MTLLAPFTPAQISAIRAALAESLAVFSRRIGVTRDAVWKWENGKRSPDPRSRRALATAERAAARARSR